MLLTNKYAHVLGFQKVAGRLYKRLSCSGLVTAATSLGKTTTTNSSEGREWSSGRLWWWVASRDLRWDWIIYFARSSNRYSSSVLYPTATRAAAAETGVGNWSKQQQATFTTKTLPKRKMVVSKSGAIEIVSLNCRSIISWGYARSRLEPKGSQSHRHRFWY